VASRLRGEPTHLRKIISGKNGNHFLVTELNGKAVIFSEFKQWMTNFH